MNFWKTFGASLLAGSIIIALFISIIFSFVGSLGEMFNVVPETIVTPNSVLRLDLGEVRDSPVVDPLEFIDPIDLKIRDINTTLDVINAISAAVVDDNIKGIYIRTTDQTMISAAGLEEVRAALEDFRATGKFVVAYDDSYSQLGYWFATVADKLFLNPQGNIEWYGVSSEVLFYKGLMDKLDIKPQIVRHGTFKAAVEPFVEREMSQANRAQNQMLVNSVWSVLVNDVAQSRGLTPEYVDHVADNLLIQNAYDALSYGFVDGLMYESEVEDFMARAIEDESLLAPSVPTLSIEQELSMTIPSVDGDVAAEQYSIDFSRELRTVNIVNFADYLIQQPLLDNDSPNKIAVIYAEGDIESYGGTKILYESEFRRQVREVAEDDAVKAVVLRINSPGGSALAAEQMWYELERLRQRKPLIVSMGNVAASGGYYIAAPADIILADKLTITGSIGVFGLYFNVGDALKKHLGVTVDGVSSNRYADIGSVFRSMNAKEREFFQNSVDEVYTTFVNRVASGRNLSYEQVDALAEGRVWSGLDALNNGLVDDIGGLIVAINLAAERAGVQDDFSIVEAVDDQTSWLDMFSAPEDVVRERVLREELGELYEPWAEISKLQKKSGIRAELPYLLQLK